MATMVGVCCGSTHNDDVDGNHATIPLPTCHAWTGRSSCDIEPNLHVMTVKYQSFHEYFYAYRTPDVATFYNDTAAAGSKQEVVVPKFQGMFGKFINLSKDPVKVYWKSSAGQEFVHIADIDPFGSAGTATFPGHTFFVTLPEVELSDLKTKKIKPLIEWKIQADNSLYYYDPYNSNPVTAQKALAPDQYHFYYLQLQNRAFAHQYREFTGTDWLALYKEKHPPLFHMWRADSFGQTHAVITNEIHFVEIPLALKGVSLYGPRPDQLAAVRKYRHQLPELRLTLTAISCAPRVFEIPNFLSQVEVDHLLTMAAETTSMQRSSTQAGSSQPAGVQQQDDKDTTRTSRNSWITRSHDMILEVINRRAADILQIDESLLRWRRKSEIPEYTDSVISIAEPIQLVHYKVGQREYPGKWSLLVFVCLCSPALTGLLTIVSIQYKILG
jgi:hypothetical protein